MVLLLLGACEGVVGGVVEGALRGLVRGRLGVEGLLSGVDAGGPV